MITKPLSLVSTVGGGTDKHGHLEVRYNDGAWLSLRNWSGCMIESEGWYRRRVGTETKEHVSC